MTLRIPTRSAVVLIPILALLSACGSGGGSGPTSPVNPPSITSLSPVAGPTSGGTSVTLQGSNFASGAQVTFGGVPGRSPSVTAGTTIVVQTPVHGAGAVAVVVTNPDGQSASVPSGFTYQAPPPPSITSLSPVAGPTSGGTSVTLLGSNFVAGAQVTFGGVPGISVAVTAGTVIVVGQTPAHAAGPVDVVVTNPDGGSASVPLGFTYQAPPPPPAPTISSVSPPTGSVNGGTTVTIVGANFVAGATVRFGGDAAGVTSVLPGAITAVTAAHVAGTVDVQVTNPDLQTTTRTAAFTFEASPPPPGPDPVVASVDPTAGTTLGGTALTVSGSNFVAGAAVFVGGVLASAATVVDPATITATTPAGAAGAADVTVVNPDGGIGTKPGAFTYQTPPPPAPTVTGVSPATGPTAGGTSVTVTGANFVSGATVSFGGTAGSAIAVVDATTITVTTPARAAGVVDVKVVNPDGGFGTKTGAFRFEPPATGNPPTITLLSPASGASAGGTLCVISGTGFLAGAAVSFGGTAASLAPGTVITPTSISVTVPAHPVGVVDVTVTNTDGNSTTRQAGYIYLGAPPVLLTINVRGGPTAGGTQVLAIGSRFLAGVSVTVGGKAATSVTLLNGGTVSFFTPPQSEGRYDVVVTNPDLQFATLVNAFHYGPAPVITTLTCSAGCDTVRPDDLITLQGANFATGAGEGISVLFTSRDTGQVTLAVVQTSSPTQIVVVAPTLDGGIPVRRYFVSVSNFDGQTGQAPNPVTYQ